MQFGAIAPPVSLLCGRNRSYCRNRDRREWEDRFRTAAERRDRGGTTDPDQGRLRAYPRPRIRRLRAGRRAYPGSKISAVQASISTPDADIIDASRTIVMPGLVDTHRHMWQGILRNVLPDSLRSPKQTLLLSEHRARPHRSRTSGPASYARLR